MSCEALFLDGQLGRNLHQRAFWYFLIVKGTAMKTAAKRYDLYVNVSVKKFFP